MYVALDFESDAIEQRPKYPPRPVGLAVYADSTDPYYLAWGHPTANNVLDDGPAKHALTDFFSQTHLFYIFHNAAFDCAIIEEKLNIKVPWERVYDTMLMAFLLDPYGELSLKPLAERHLGEPPTERDEVRDWLIRNGHCAINSKDWGAHIGKAPGFVVAPYAIGDVRRTMGLFHYFKPKLEARGMM